MADKYEAAASTMDTAIKNNGGNLETLKPKIDAAYSSMSSLGFNSTDTAQAIAQLTTSTGSPTKAISLLGEAADLARFKHISLADASSLLGKVMAGSNRVVTSSASTSTSAQASSPRSRRRAKPSPPHS